MCNLYLSNFGNLVIEQKADYPKGIYKRFNRNVIQILQRAKEASENGQTERLIGDITPILASINGKNIFDLLDYDLLTFTQIADLITKKVESNEEGGAETDLLKVA